MPAHAARTRPSLRRTLLHLGAASLAACSGGGDGGNGLPTEPTTPSLGTALTSGTAVQNLGGAEGSTRLYRITVPAGATLLDVRTSGGTGDVDLFVRRGQEPSASGVDCASEGDDNTEQCVFANPAAGEWYILLAAFETYSGLTLTATVTGGGTTPTNPTNPGGNASFMSARLLTPPGIPAGLQATEMAVTNAGVYLLYREEDVGDHVVRFESGASLTNGWTSFSPGFYLSHFAPASLTLERDETFVAYWVGSASCWNLAEAKAGLYVLNTGVPSFETKNDICAHAIVPSSSERTTLAHSWVVASQHGSVSEPKGGFYVEKAQKGGANALSSDYEKVAELVDYTALATSPEDNALWVGGTGKLYEIQEDGTQTVYDLSPYGGTAWVTALKFQGDALWIGYGGEILRMRNGVVDKRFPHAVNAMGLHSQFCVQGSTLYLTGGTKVDVNTGQSRSYIADRDVSQMTSPADIEKYLDLLQKSSGMLDCSPAGTSGVLYTVTPQGVYEIVAK